MTRAERLADYFQRRPGQWLSAFDLADVGGLLSFRTRVSELRRPPFNLDVENRVRRGQRADGTPYSISEYRLKVRGDPPAREVPTIDAPTSTAGGV